MTTPTSNPDERDSRQPEPEPAEHETEREREHETEREREHETERDERASLVVRPGVFLTLLIASALAAGAVIYWWLRSMRI